MIKKVGDWLRPEDAERGHHKAAFHDGRSVGEFGGGKMAVFHFDTFVRHVRWGLTGLTGGFDV